MKRIAGLMLVLAGCSSAVPSGAPPQAGGDAGSPPADGGVLGPPADAGAPPPAADAGFREFDGTARYPGLVPQLVEPGAQILLAVSPDERQAVVSHDPRPPWCTCNPHSAPQCTDAVDTEISIVTIGAPTVAVATRANSAQFSSDGRFITLASGGCNDSHTKIVRSSDASDVQLNPGYFFEPGWIYSSDETGLYRQHDLG